MDIEQVKKTWAKHLETEDGMALISTKHFKWLVQQAEQAEELRKDVQFFKNRNVVHAIVTQELISLSDARVKEILTKVRML